MTMRLVGFAVVVLGLWIAFTSTASAARAGGLMVATARAAVAAFQTAPWALYVALAP
ncbi:hypothetical protein ABZZ17_18675 [Streptomyces sp. NPDC006512]|uniref:hypothetical protein n=1 Tax=Streptomyces sp. NPDC006512 TaxID=3154307 RepID=UPI0033B2689F